MREKIFRFKQFAVKNDLSAMKVGTDGVLLGAWCNVSDAKTILDIGTGCGLIALMTAQRNNIAKITAIDIDSNAAKEAAENFNNSPWKDRLTSIQTDFIEFANNTTHKFDLIVSNPPYFDNSLLCPDSTRSTARHTNSLSYKSLISLSANLLDDNGKLCIITPADKEEIIVQVASDSSLNIVKRTYIYPVNNSPAKRILFEISKEAEVKRSINNLTIEISRHCYTQEYISLTKDFYLNM